MTPWVLGIDPGLKGGFAALTLDYDNELTVQRADGVDGYLGPRAVLERGYPAALTAFATEMGCPPTLTVIEAVQLRPHQGLHAQARAAYGIGILVGAVASRGWAWEQPTPAHWHQLLGIPAAEDPKQAVFEWCARRLPNLDLALGGRKPHDGVADAAALAYYGRLILRGGRRRQVTEPTTN